MSTHDENRDPFDSILSLEDQFYQEGYKLGEEDGRRAGLLEGRLFGLEKGFEKYACMGQLHGRAVVWAGLIPSEDHSAHTSPNTETLDKDIKTSSGKTCRAKDPDHTTKLQNKGDRSVDSNSTKPRLESHIRMLFALTEPESLSTKNSEDAVTDFDDRLRRAQGKTKLIEKLTGDTGKYLDVMDKTQKSTGERSFEDLSSLHARH